MTFVDSPGNGIICMPLICHGFAPSTPIYDGTAYLAVGSVAEIREVFYVVQTGSPPPPSPRNLSIGGSARNILTGGAAREAKTL
jgi:hypothetical protein